MAERGGAAEGLMALECSAVTRRDESLRLAWTRGEGRGACSRVLERIRRRFLQTALAREWQNSPAVGGSARCCQPIELKHVASVCVGIRSTKIHTPGSSKF